MHTIVIADDNISFAEEMRNYFTDNTDFKVVGIAPDGVEAIKLVEKHKPDFLLLDIVMPELDGFGVLSALSAFDEKPKTIMVSGLATDGFVTKSLRLGASYFMAKPVNYDKLAEYMREMLAPAATVAAWNRGKIENINSIFGIKVYTANDKPTNGEFIALVADKMILEGA